MHTLYKKKLLQGLEFSCFIIPAVLCIATFVGIPFVMCIYYSFRKWNGINKDSLFIGFENYKQLFISDPIFIKSISYTLIFALCVVIIVNILALLIAALLESNIKGKGFFRAAFYIPNIMSLVIIGFIWKFTFSRVFDALGVMTGLQFFGLSWLGDRHLAVVSTVFVSIWQSLGFYMIIYIAGLQSVPEDITEAAVMDGAGPGRRFFAVTLPLIMPSITSCMFFSIASSLKVFEMIFTLTGGGPGTATTPVALDIYNTAFNSNQFGYGSAKSVILFIMVALITIIQVTFFKRKELEL